MFNFCFFFKRISQIIFFPNVNININLINVSSSFGVNFILSENYYNENKRSFNNLVTIRIKISFPVLFYINRTYVANPLFV